MFLLFKNTMLILAFYVFTSCTNAQEQKVRAAGVAGGFYPKDSTQLSQMIDGFLLQVPEQNIEGDIFAIISPHAGYVYSGHVAAYGYSILKNRNIKRVIIISPSHLESFRGVSVYNGDAYSTPLGKLFVDKQFAKKLADSNNLIKLSGSGHESVIQGRMEHALEVQLPFLQKVITEFKIVPIIIGDQQYESCRALGMALGKLIDSRETIIVASSDLSHFHDYNTATEKDKKVLNAIKEWDFFNLSRNLQSGIWEACGGGPIVATMIAAEKAGINAAKLLKYANSGDVEIGDKSRVVGYSSFVFYNSSQWKERNSYHFSLTKPEQQELLDIAKQSVESIVRTNKLVELDRAQFESLTLDRGAFVTLKKAGHLRGCIGYTSAVQPLNLTVRNAAASAAVKDYRFPVVKKEELNQLKYEISVLSPFRLVTNTEQIKVGKDGLFIKNGNSEGLLLPQVAEEYHWDNLTFLEHTCQKAGLPSDAWKDDDTDIFRFTAFVFGEE